MQDGIFVAAPPERPWEVDLRQVERWLEERWPDIRIRHERTPISPTDYLSFSVAVGGEVRHGAYFDRTDLVLRDGKPEDWAEFIVWFLGRLPVGSGAFGMLEYVPEPAPLPTPPTAENITAFFDSLAASADE